MTEKNYSLQIPSSPKYLPRVEKFLEKIAKGTSLTPTRLNEIMLAVNEAISNAMLHGNKSDTHKKVFIDVHLNDTQLTIRIKDQGKGFNPETVPDPTTPENIFKDSGRGLYIMKTCMDEVLYDFHPDGTELLLRLFLNKS